MLRESGSPARRSIARSRSLEHVLVTRGTGIDEVVLDQLAVASPVAFARVAIVVQFE